MPSLPTQPPELDEKLVSNAAQVAPLLSAPDDLVVVARVRMKLRRPSRALSRENTASFRGCWLPSAAVVGASDAGVRAGAGPPAARGAFVASDADTGRRCSTSSTKWNACSWRAKCTQRARVCGTTTVATCSRTSSKRLATAAGDDDTAP
eukprot:scaffold679_cov374-Prasinococcus_capsulatus_cf.AAC.6